VGIATQLHPAYVLVAYFTAYLVLGLVESVLSLRHRLTRKVPAGATSAALLAAEEAEEEAEDNEDEQDYL
jgi:CDP-diacylglycerol---serine O-phosphatidyltransferase